MTPFHACLLTLTLIANTTIDELRHQVPPDVIHPHGYSDFTDPLACSDLEVVEFDASTANPRQFKVMFKDGKWVIPSHHNYPADAKDRLAKTAGGVRVAVCDDPQGAAFAMYQGPST